VIVAATDTTGASSSASFTWTINSSGTGTCTSTTNVVGNPNFASDSKDWTASSGVIGEYASDGRPPISGCNYDAWLDGYAEPHTDTLSQSVTVPSGCTGMLEVWLHIDSDQTSGTNGSFTVSVVRGLIARGDRPLRVAEGRSERLEHPAVEPVPPFLAGLARYRLHPHDQIEVSPVEGEPLPGCAVEGDRAAGGTVAVKERVVLLDVAEYRQRDELRQRVAPERPFGVDQRAMSVGDDISVA
jgi:hypothetical protein